MKHTGGCLCGEVRFEVEGEPSMVGLCHCRYCQLRTGSAFGISIYFPTTNVNVISGDFDKYSYNTTSGGKVEVERCKTCGTSLFWELKLKKLKGPKGTAGGSYDPPTFWYKIEHEVFARSKANFCTIDPPVSYTASFAPSSVMEKGPRLTGG
jgi:hypothetical protein